MEQNVTRSAQRTALNLSESEFSNIDEYRKKKNTAVLTIMFTDIQGFTALTENKGETYVHDLHTRHDKILVETIEEDNAGVVIKYIGDSIMAVFAEPTAAAEKSLKIQRKLHEFNKAHPELDDIKVRIGLHMGQTVIENKIQTDLFGRHVNKASRVESLAAGGHIFISYPVFDSVKSSLMDVDGAAWKLHGSYYLKGIDKAEEIYEIYETGITVPQAPKTARRHNSLPAFVPALAAALILLVSVGLFVTLRRDSAVAATPPDQAAPATEAPAKADTGQAEEQKAATKVEKPAAPASTDKPVPTEVHFLGMIAREPILDFDTPLAVILEDETQGLKKSVNDIPPGKHIIHYVVSYIVRYFAEFTVKPGKNVIQITFKESYLPNADINYSLEYDGPEAKKASSEESYFVYDHQTLKRLDFKGKVTAEVTAAKTADNTVTFDVHFTASVNDATVADKTIQVVSPEAGTERTYADAITIHDGPDHFYFIKYSYVRDSINFSIGASFKD